MASDNATPGQVHIEFADGGRMVLPESFRPGDPSFWASVIADTVRAGKSSASMLASRMDLPSLNSPLASTTLAATAAPPFLASSPHDDPGDAMASTAAVPFTAASPNEDLHDAVAETVAMKREIPDPDPDYTSEEEDHDSEDEVEVVSTSRIKLVGRPVLTVKLRRPQSTTTDNASTAEQQLFTHTSTRELIVDRHGVECTSCQELDLECIDVPSPRGYRCVGCQQLKRSCDWGEAWLRNNRIHKYMNCLKDGYSLEDADQEVYEYLGILGGPLDKVKTYSWMAPSAVPSGSGRQAL
ncbi:zinc finger transcription factor [Pseudozyma hubeiensis SY62]|uniref:Zinc finger transcription factor n=1 Tax=Pseudozyma hubeiensis (strain SY62) TaxID=1305764 RepID=R9P7U8_PSEHS|nr:zinc finger transcription factor [Pseudozyma hubeiensis SY62]GAC97473.1 zinc finger transcription factor [Pseudozyma hubeiensis SY62]